MYIYIYLRLAPAAVGPGSRRAGGCPQTAAGCPPRRGAAARLAQTDGVPTRQSTETRASLAGGQREETWSRCHTPPLTEVCSLPPSLLALAPLWPRAL